MTHSVHEVEACGPAAGFGGRPGQSVVGRRRTVDPDHDPPGRVVAVAGRRHDGHRARRVGQAALADGPEQQSGEAAPPAGTDDEEIGALGGGQQGGGGVLELEPFPDAGQPGHLGSHPGHGVQQLAVGGVLEQGLVLVQVLSGQRVGGQPGMDHVEQGVRQHRLAAAHRSALSDAPEPSTPTTIRPAETRWSVTPPGWLVECRIARVVGPAPSGLPGGSVSAPLGVPAAGHPWD